MESPRLWLTSQEGLRDMQCRISPWPLEAEDMLKSMLERIRQKERHEEMGKMRVDRLRLLGNGVVPQTAARAWVTLSEELGL